FCGGVGFVWCGVGVCGVWVVGGFVCCGVGGVGGWGCEGGGLGGFGLFFFGGGFLCVCRWCCFGCVGFWWGCGVGGGFWCVLVCSLCCLGWR
ncbi:hypothetical protein RA279_27930, partial [Pseudomonas syringae pv. tagetis]|uniref:hypothetical protein n=1 Tax=Pseudomonas syringae group genomosp. 7 TaxID=251699 RepID=UPI00376F8517